MAEIRAAEWYGAAGAALVKVSPHPLFGRPGADVRARLRRHARAGRAVAAGAAGRRRHEVVAVVTRPDAPAGRGRQADPLARRRAGRRGRHRRCSPRARRASRTSSPRCATLAPDCVPGRRLRRPGAAGRAGHPAARLGQPALLAAARLARRRARCSTRSGTATRSPAPRLPARGGAGHRAGLRHVTEPIRRRHRRRPARPARRSRRRLLVATLDGIDDGTLVPAPQPADGVSLPPRSPSRTRGSTGPRPARAVDRLIRAGTPAPGAWTTFRDERLKLGRCAPVAGRARSARGAAGRAAAGARRHRRPTPVALGEVRPPASADAGGRLGPRRAASSRASGCDDRPGAARPRPAGPPRQRRRTARPHRPAPAAGARPGPAGRATTLLARGRVARRLRQPRAAGDPARAPAAPAATPRSPPSSPTARCAPAGLLDA